MKKPSRIPVVIAAVALVAGVSFVLMSKVTADEADEPDAALERTRKQVRMLDDIYKGGIVLITTYYVDGESDLPAGAAFKKLFEAAKEKGWHEVRLLDATGTPFNDENAPQDDFEKSAIELLKKGKSFVDTTVVKNGKQYLRAATPIPVVMKKCIMCHDNYADVPKNMPIGALAYTVPIE